MFPTLPRTQATVQSASQYRESAAPCVSTCSQFSTPLLRALVLAMNLQCTPCPTARYVPYAFPASSRAQQCTGNQ